MEGILSLGFIKEICIFIGLIGILVGLDLICGAKITTFLKNILDKTAFILDSLIIRIAVSFKRTLDIGVNFDEIIINSNAKIILGIFLLALSIIIIILAARLP